MNIGEICDRLSILFHKVDKVGKKALPEFYAFAKEVLLNSKPEDFEDMVKCIRHLHRINGIIWALEARLGKEGEMGLEEVGRRALEISYFYAQRIKIKNRISGEKGQFQDIKTEHCSTSPPGLNPRKKNKMWKPNLKEEEFLKLIASMTLDCLMGKGTVDRNDYIANLRLICRELDKV